MSKKGNPTTTDLRNHLFAQIERLNDPKCDLKLELEKAKAIAAVGNVIVNSVKIENDFMRLTGGQPDGQSLPGKNEKLLENE